MPGASLTVWAQHQIYEIWATFQGSSSKVIIKLKGQVHSKKFKSKPHVTRPQPFCGRICVGQHKLCKIGEHSGGLGQRSPFRSKVKASFALHELLELPSWVLIIHHQSHRVSSVRRVSIEWASSGRRSLDGHSMALDRHSTDTQRVLGTRQSVGLVV